MKFAESFIGWYLGVCTKIFFLFLPVRIGLTLTDEWNHTLQNWKGENISIPIAMAGAFIFFIVARHVSNTAGAMVGQSVTMHAGHILAGAAATYGSFRAAKMSGKAALAGATGGLGLAAAGGILAARGGRSLFTDRSPRTSTASSSTPQPPASQAATTRLATNTPSTSAISSPRGTNGVFYNPDGSAWTPHQARAGR